MKLSVIISKNTYKILQNLSNSSCCFEQVLNLLVSSFSEELQKAALNNFPK